MLENIYTTKMGADKKTIENRFANIRSANTRIHKVMATLTTVAVIIAMLCANIVMAAVDEQTTEGCKIEVRSAETVLNFNNKPFVENNTVYFPLRETFEKFGITEHKDSYINWNNGIIDICAARSEDDENTVNKLTELYYFKIEIGKPVLIENAMKSFSGQDLSTPVAMNNAPVLKNGVTYIPFEYIKRFDVARFFMNLNFTIIFKDGNEIYSVPYLQTKTVSPDAEPKPTVDTKDAPSVLNYFLKALYRTDYSVMTSLCTENCINTHFRDIASDENASVYGIHRASVKSINWGFTNKENDYSKEPITVTLDCELPAYSSVSKEEREVKVYFEKQSDGTFLISNFTN